MECWTAIIKERNNDVLLSPSWCGDKFDTIQDPNVREFQIRSFLEDFWGLKKHDVEWFVLKRANSDGNQDVNHVTAFMLYIYNKWCIGEAKKVFGEFLGEHIYSKFLYYRTNLGDLFWYSELDGTCRQKIVERAVELYGKESPFTTH